MVSDGRALGTLVPLPTCEVEDHGDAVLRLFLKRMLPRNDQVGVVIECEDSRAYLTCKMFVFFSNSSSCHGYTTSGRESWWLQSVV